MVHSDGVLQRHTVYSDSRTPFVFLLLLVLSVSISGLSVISFVGLYGKGFPVDSSTVLI